MRRACLSRVGAEVVQVWIRLQCSPDDCPRGLVVLVLVLVSKWRVPLLQVIPEDTLWDYRPDAPEVSLIRFTSLVFR